MAVGVQVADGGNGGPVSGVGVFEDAGEDAFAFAVADDVDERVFAQEGFGLVGHLRAAEDNEDIGAELFEQASEVERLADVPDCRR